MGSITKRARILHCIGNMGGGGAERHVAYLSKGLVLSGWDVTVALLDPGPNMKWLERSGAQIELLTHRTHYDPRIVWQLFNLIRRFKPDIVHTWLLMMNTAGGMAAGLTGELLFGGIQNSAMAYPDNLKYRLQNSVLSWWATAVIANSNAGLDYLHAHLKGTIAAYVVPNGLPLSEIENVSPASRQTMGVRRDAEVILFAGRFEAQKNIGNLLRALQIVLATRPKAIAILCGTGSMRKECSEWASRHGLQERIRFPGFLIDLWSWMKSSDVFVFPTLFEGQPNVVLEAMACECPLVVSDIPEHREFLDEGSALFVAPESPKKIARAIIETLADGNRSRARAANARTQVAKYSIERMVSSYQRVYEQHLETR